MVTHHDKHGVHGGLSSNTSRNSANIANVALPIQTRDEYINFLGLYGPKSREALLFLEHFKRHLRPLPSASLVSNTPEPKDHTADTQLSILSTN